MNKSRLFSYLLLFMIAFVAASSSHADSSPANKTIKCLGEGMTGGVSGVPGPKGWKLDPPCCPGLQDRESLAFCGKGYGGSYQYVCVACGDHKCDARYESACNCPEDCAKK